MKVSLKLSLLSQIVLVDSKRGSNFFTKRQRALKKVGSSHFKKTDDKLEQDTLTSQECIPDSNRIDLGFLPCGRGSYCAPTKGSVLGGICSPISNNARVLQACPRPDFDAYGCDCSNYVTGMGGPINDCIIAEEYCAALEGEPSGETEVCYDVTLDGNLNASGKLETRNGCYNLTSPYARQLCVAYTYGSDYAVLSCEISIDGVTCNSCTPSLCQGNGNDYFSFDCTNIDAASNGNTCDGALPLPILQYVPESTETPTTDETPTPTVLSGTLSPTGIMDDTPMDMPTMLSTPMNTPSPITTDETPMPSMPGTTPSPVESPSPGIPPADMPSNAPASSDSPFAAINGFASTATTIAAVLSLFW